MFRTAICYQLVCPVEFPGLAISTSWFFSFVLFRVASVSHFTRGDLSFFNQHCHLLSQTASFFLNWKKLNWSGVPPLAVSHSQGKARCLMSVVLLADQIWALTWVLISVTWRKQFNNGTLMNQPFKGMIQRGWCFGACRLWMVCFLIIVIFPVDLFIHICVIFRTENISWQWDRNVQALDWEPKSSGWFLLGG